MNFQTVSVIGLGYIGLPTAAMIASRGVRVIGVDVNPQAVETINDGRIHIVEPELDVVVSKVVRKGLLTATLIPEPAQAFLIAVPTPFITSLSANSIPKPDLSYIKSAAKSVAKILKKGDLIILESTSPVGTTEQMAAWLSEERPDLTFPQTHGEASDIRVAYCPERVLPGKVVRELVENDRVIGGMTALCAKKAADLYSIFVHGDCIKTSVRTAEMTKLTENACRDVQIAFANELSIICDDLDIDVWELISLANRHPRVNILNPGPGVGGHCISVDPWFIVNQSPEKAKIIFQARKINDFKPEWILKKIDETLGIFLNEHPTKSSADVKIACYGLAFKPDIDDLRESPAVHIATNILKNLNSKLLVVEPNIEKLPSRLKAAELVGAEEANELADIHVYLVFHRQFKSMDTKHEYYVDAVGLRN